MLGSSKGGSTFKVQSFKVICKPFQSLAGFNNMTDFNVSGILETSK